MLDQQAVAMVLAAVIAAIASIIAAVLSRRSSKTADAIDRAMQIRQARLDERDLIVRAGGFAIPVDNDGMWRDYHQLLSALIGSGASSDTARREASENVRQQAPRTPNSLVAEPLS